MPLSNRGRLMGGGELGGGDILDASLMARWRFENGALTTDSKGGHTLTNNNTVTVDTTNYWEGSASALFVAASKQYFSLIDSLLNINFPFKFGTTNNLMSVCFFFKMGTTSTDRGFITKYNHSSNLRTFALSLTTTTLRFSYGYNNGVSGIIHDDVTGIVAGKIYHVGFVLDNVNKTRKWRVWNVTDNVLLSSTSGLTQANTISICDVPLNIGAFGYLNDAAFCVDGNMDDVRVYNTLLTNDNIDYIRMNG